jgi:carboxypeptidase PM20D1
MSAGATDALIYTNAGIPTYGSSGIFAAGSEGFAHGLNEKIRVPSFYAAVDHIHDLALALSR